MKKYVIIFRSSLTISNEELEEKIKNLGFQVKTYPILEIKNIRKERISTLNAQAICTSSVNGILILSRLIRDRKIKIFTMGSSSSRTAKECGFKNIIDCNADSDRMLELINKTVKGNGEIIYAGAKKISNDLPSILTSNGYNVNRYILYETVFTKFLHKEFINIVNTEQLAWIVLLSRKGARNCIRLLKKSFTDAKINSINFACLSSNIAKTLPKSIINKRYAKNPDTREIVKILSWEK
tara:strand:+ start:238 stop:954 length:717 start_codon:yes stop_codon:yes gene_type:complete